MTPSDLPIPGNPSGGAPLDSTRSLQRVPPIITAPRLESRIPPPPPHGLSRLRLILAMTIAGLSDMISVGSELMPATQWAVDLTTAVLLFMILGWRWWLLPALIAEAIPGVALFPTWVLVVASIAVWGKVKTDIQR